MRGGWYAAELGVAVCKLEQWDTMGLLEFAATSTVIIGSRCTSKVCKKAFCEVPTRAFHALFGDSGVEGELESLLRNRTHVLARMIDVTYDIANHPCKSVNAPRDVQESMKSLRASGCEQLSAVELISALPGNETRMAEDDLTVLLEDPRCLVTVWKMRGAEQDKYVVAVRGTRLTSFTDLKDDVQIACEQSHDTGRVKRIYALTRKLIERYGRESVILTGHSLGAAVSFHVCRKLYLEHSEVEGHFFELPFMTLDKVLKKFLKFWQMEVLGLMFAADVLRLKSVLECLWGKLIEPSARLLEFDVDAARAEFESLEDWHPFIYVQKYDDISNEYIDFFNYNCTHSDGRGISRVTAILNKLGIAAQARHLCPSAHLITSDKGVGTLTSHGISNWIDVERIRVKCAKYTSLYREHQMEWWAHKRKGYGIQGKCTPESLEFRDFLIYEDDLRYFVKLRICNPLPVVSHYLQIENKK